ncbi:hypothetical protein GFS31_38620 [Leptolyngbya sp. BL0902]|nr:hypothetical protein GFS31_38620 [Leptolyngbya sp. BL0902]
MTPARIKRHTVNYYERLQGENSLGHPPHSGSPLLAGEGLG